MVGFGEQMGQPEHAHPSQAQADPVTLGGQGLVQPRLAPHPLQRGQEQGKVIDTCRGQGQVLGHGHSSLRLAPRRQLSHGPAIGVPAVGSSRISAVESERPYHNARNCSKFARPVS
jgi:hypothetical protein